jgi:hypothetical protein
MKLQQIIVTGVYQNQNHVSRHAQQLRNISPSHDTVSWLIAHVSEVLEEQLIEKFKNKRFSVQINKAIDCSGAGHLIAYMRYVEHNKN